MSTALLDLASLTFQGQSAALGHADVVSALVEGGVTVRETITGSSTLDLTLSDPDWALTNSTLMQARTATVIDGVGFEVTALDRQGLHLRVTCEDLAVAALTRKTGYRASKVGTTARADFCRLLIREVPWVKVVAAPGAAALEQLARGTDPSTATGTETTQPPENTWAAVARIMGAIGWRAFSHRGTVYLAPDSWLVTNRPGKYTLTPTSDGVENINFTVDVGQPSQSATLTVIAGTMDLIPGTSVTLAKVGVGSGQWLVETITRTYSSKRATVNLVRPQAALPEPKDSGTAGNVGEGGYSGSTLADGGSSSGNADVDAFVNAALSKKGNPYKMGGNGPLAYDCSHLVAYAAGKAGIKASAPVSALLQLCSTKGRLITVDQAMITRGALLIRGPNEHVAISLGNATTIEAHGKADGIGIHPATGRKWTTGGILPGLNLTVPAAKDLRN